MLRRPSSAPRFFLFLLALTVAGLSIFSLTAAETKTKDGAENQAEKKQAAGKDKQPEFDEASLEFFEKQVRPLLVKRCYKCHGPDSKEAKGGLRLDSRAAALAGGDSGPAVVPGNLKESLLIDSINYGELYQMPPKTKMPAAEIAVLTKWVKMGAPWPKTEGVAATHGKGRDYQKELAEHWCWQPVRDHAPPKVKNAAWPKQGLDHFVLARLEEKGLTPAKPADRRTLIRRVYFDLIGLPPTPAQVQSFVDDKTPDAYEKVVDELLRSPHFGERWARHWMDMTRYAESYGHEFDYPVPHATQYRDYLIRSFNADVPYDRFIIEHIAGDLVENPRRHPQRGYNESIIGTGFWWLGEATHAPVDVVDDEANRIDNQIDVMSKSFLGLTVACARCHEHKFDPIPTEDYYALVGFLQSSRRHEALLDPEQKIAAATKRIQAAREKADEAIAKATPENASRKDFAHYLLAASEVLYGKPRDNERGALRPDILFEDFEKPTYEGWTVTGNAFAAGTATPQQVASYLGDVGAHGKRFAQTHFRINGQNSRQTDRKTGTLTSSKFKIERRFVSFLIGGGAHRGRTCLNLLVDGKVVASATGRNSGRLYPHRFDVAQFAGKEGQIQIVDNEQGGWGNVGVDHIVFSDHTDGSASGRPLAAVAKEFQLDQQRLGRWVEALRDESLKQAGHPIEPWRQLASQGTNRKAEAFQQQRQRLKEDVRLAAQQEKDAPLFADFNSGDYTGWLPSGDAFGQQPTQPRQWDSQSQGVALAPVGVAHSGLLGSKQQGVLRSPNFLLTHKNIHYRLAAKNVQIRLIIEGYFMDVYNGLLFRGISINVNTNGKFVWQTQSQDVGKYAGRTAYIEIIDRGDGYAAIDEIRFSNGSPPTARPNPLGIAAFGDKGITSLPALAESYGDQWNKSLAAWRTGKCDAAQAELVGWALKHQLFDIDPQVTSQLASAFEVVDAENKAMPAPMRVLAMTDGSEENEQVFIRGNHNIQGKEVPRRMLTALGGEKDTPITSGSGRLRLARQIASSDNPLTARVAVNRLWHHVMGRGIVASVDNFGVLGQKPTHDKLLDYLAARFVQEGWSVKKSLRRIVLSSTYRMSSEPDARDDELDPQNLLLHRANIRRLQGEAIRDAILAVSGRLDPKQFGPSVPVHLTPFMQGRGRPRSGPLDGAGRRSIYTSVRRNFLSPMMLAFDTPIPFNAVGRRNSSNVPAQALIMMNDPFVVGQARVWAERLLADKELATHKRIELMYLAAFARPPSKNEAAVALAFLDSQGKQHGLTAEQAHSDMRVWADLCHVMMNVKEFIFIH